MLNPLPVTQAFPVYEAEWRANLDFHFGADFKGAVVRLGAKGEGRFRDLGSGVIVSPDGRVITAAHVLDKREPGDLIAIGTYQSDEGSTHWEYYAVLLTPDQDLLEEDRKGRRVDYAVLAIRGRLELRPAEFRGIGTNYETISIEPTPLTFDSFVRPAPPEALKNLHGKEVLLCGYPSPELTEWTSIFVSRGSICFRDDTGMLGVHAFIHDGSSGGPAFIRHEGTMYVAGIVSHNPTYRSRRGREVIHNLACIRSVHASCLRMLPQHYASVHA